MSERPLYIFDIDGTLADNTHRAHYLTNKDDPWRWDKFYSECERDAPRNAVLTTLELLYESGADIWFFTGRPEECRVKTLSWLWTYTPMTRSTIDESLTMRASKDFRPDHVVKKEMLDRMLDVDRKRLVAVFDDRQQVVDMWRANRVNCFQVAAGDF